MKCQKYEDYMKTAYLLVESGPARCLSCPVEWPLWTEVQPNRLTNSKIPTLILQPYWLLPRAIESKNIQRDSAMG